MPQPSSKRIILGKVASAYGIKGWLKIVSYTEPLENILDYKPWQLVKGQQSKEVILANSKIHNNGLIVQFVGCNDRDIASSFTGAEITVNRDQLPPLPPGEYYWSDLEGMEVLTTNNYSLGKVQEVLATGANDVLVVQGEKRRLLPFLLNQVVLEVNLATKTIRVDWDPEF